MIHDSCPPFPGELCIDADLPRTRVSFVTSVTFSEEQLRSAIFRRGPQEEDSENRSEFFSPKSNFTKSYCWAAGPLGPALFSLLLAKNFRGPRDATKKQIKTGRYK